MFARHVLLGGGTGFIGSRLSKLLTHNGYKVTTISRKPGLKRITWHDLEKSGIPRGVTAVVNLTGQNILDPIRWWQPVFTENIWNSRIKSAMTLVRAIEVSPEKVKSFINISDACHYKPDGQVYSEDSPVEGYDFMSRLCREWEKAATIPPGIDCRSVKIRAGRVIGREGGIIQSIFRPFQLGFGGRMGSGKQPMPWIHVEDLCRLIQYCIENENASGVLNGVAPEICTNAEFCKAFAAALHRPSLFAIPRFVLELLYGKNGSALLLNGAKVEPKRTLELGFRYKYPMAHMSCKEIVQGQ